MSEFDEKTEATNQELKCCNCAAILHYSPGTTNLKCTYCGADNPIIVSDEKIEELDFTSFLNEQYKKEDTVEVISVKCTVCAAQTTLQPNVTASDCPYCSSPLVVSSGSANKIVKPKSLLPFKIDRKQAIDSFKNWVRKLWFAPSNLKKYASLEKINGIYIPYWTYDTDAHTQYSGRRGDYYYVTENYTTTENGKSVTKTRQVRHTRWTPVSGNVQDVFDDLLVNASKSLPEKYVRKLEPWDLANLSPFDEKFLSGFKAESYQMDVKEGFDIAKTIMDPVIRATIKKNIGGDEQQINSMSVDYRSITFKHILLPLWISSYIYNKKVYRFLVNARTGEVQGERPYSFWKIFFFVLSIIGVGVGIYFLTQYFGK
ncbi:MAG: hypothetical protein V2A54_00255 [Bacteroidota bacterium]